MAYEGKNKEMAAMSASVDLTTDPQRIRRYVPMFQPHAPGGAMMIQNATGDWVPFNAFLMLAERLAAMELELAEARNEAHRRESAKDAR